MRWSLRHLLRSHPPTARLCKAMFRLAFAILHMVYHENDSTIIAGGANY